MSQATLRIFGLLIFFVLFAPASSPAEDRLRIGAFDLLFTEEENGVQLFQISGPPLEPEVSVKPFLVDKPTRIVIDITPPVGPRSLSGRYRLSSTLCPRIRIGVDERKTRIVLDCDELKASEKSLAFQAEKSGQVASVRFRVPTLVTTTTSTSSTSTTVVPTTTSTTTSTTEPTSTTSSSTTSSTTTSSSSTTSSSTSSTSTTSTTSTTTTSISTTSTLRHDSALSGKNELLRAAFVNHSSGDGAILLEFTSPEDYLLIKGSDGRTTFSMAKARISAEHLKLEQFAPDTIKGLSALVPDSNSDSLSMTIFLEPGYTLQGEWSGKILYLRAQRSETAKDP